eukprot:CAMPEP_0180633874 /NCGR_PEP_ID=MMETSP1037_2-20121125/41816_1 /TAXON_ID=632150 /ORGANISM="Azadinium spinosum, Strain 3D9" /LENGTH=263 /DNA_ID=CAMNT_0022654949 /DNA_START=231 /DNA_END=1023 /DNA_ORIENTATION=-
MAQCQHCDIVGTPAEVIKEGSHHAVRCPRYAKKDTAKQGQATCGVCKYCGYQGPAAKVTASGSHHSSTCPRYKDPATEGCWWPFCNACSASPAQSPELVGEKERDGQKDGAAQEDEAPAGPPPAGTAEGVEEKKVDEQDEVREDETTKADTNTIKFWGYLEEVALCGRKEFLDAVERAVQAGLADLAQGGLGDLGKKPYEAPAELPRAPAEAPKEPVRMQIQVPAGVMPGQMLQAQTPEGQIVQVAVPEGMAPGSMLLIEVPA